MKLTQPPWEKWQSVLLNIIRKRGDFYLRKSGGGKWNLKKKVAKKCTLPLPQLPHHLSLSKFNECYFNTRNNSIFRSSARKRKGLQNNQNQIKILKTQTLILKGLFKGWFPNEPSLRYIQFWLNTATLEWFSAIFTLQINGSQKWKTRTDYIICPELKNK